MKRKQLGKATKTSSATVTGSGKQKKVGDRKKLHEGGGASTIWYFEEDKKGDGTKFNLNVKNTIGPSGADIFSAIVSPVPEPSSVLLLGAGILGMGRVLRRRPRGDLGARVPLRPLECRAKSNGEAFG